jgi:hypothetical protein
MPRAIFGRAAEIAHREPIQRLIELSEPDRDPLPGKTEY